MPSVPGKEGRNIVRLWNNSPTALLTCKAIAFKSTKLEVLFHMKDRINNNHQHDVFYQLTCPERPCGQIYIDETARRLLVQVAEHGKQDNLSMFQHFTKH